MNRAQSAHSTQLIDAFIATGKVTEIGIGGSIASGKAESSSDIDIYVFTREQITPGQRCELIEAITGPDSSHEIPNPYWGDGDYVKIDGVPHDIMYLDDAFFEGVRRVVDEHHASEGYTTAFVHTLASMIPLYDPAGRLASWKDRLSSYPEPLVAAIMERNHAVMRSVATSYRNQAVSAAAGQDVVAVNHRVTALLACVFDIAFAYTRMWHPGEKRQLLYLDAHRDDLPAGFHDHVLAVLHHTAPDRLEGLEAAIDLLVADVDKMVAAAS